MKHIDVLILVEHKDRELQSAILLKELLASERGLKVEIASLVFDLWKVVLKYRPRFVIMPYCRWDRTDSVALFQYLYKNQICFVNLNYEQICNPNLNDEKKPRDTFAREELVYTCWGLSSKEFFENCGVPESHLLITGKLENYILNAMAKSDRKALKHQIAQLNPELSESDKWIFAPMDDNWVFLKDLTDKFYKKGTWSKENVIEYKKYLSDTVFMFLEWVCNLNESKMEDEHIKLIIRPHPGVGVDYYQRYFNDKLGKIPSFVYLSKEYTAKEWIVVCDKCVSNYSTLLLDSSYVGIPSGLVRKENIPQNEKMDWFDDITGLKTYSDFCSFIYESSRLGQSYGSLDKYIDTTTNPIAVIGGFIYEHLGDERVKVFPERLITLLFLRFKYFMPSMLRTVAYKAKSDAFGLSKLKYDFLTQENIESTRSHLQKWFNI